MNAYRVEWDALAEDELARIWLFYFDPTAVTAAQARADQLLARNPLHSGRHLSEGLYSLDIPPLILAYSIDAVNRLVEVTWVRLSNP